MIPRNPEAFSRDQYDLVIIGGGIYGACLSLQAARCGLRSILLEREDFGGATSWNSLRILHGGLRYLQTLDLPRFRESVAERHWFCKHFPDLVRPLPCLMPLYGRGLKRKAAFGPALRLNDWLSSYRNDSVAESIRLPNGRILPAEQTLATFSRVNSAGLEAAGFWYDAMMLNPQRVLIEILRWSCSLGARAQNYVEARELLTDKGRVRGVRAMDRLASRMLEFRARTVINCAGPWSREVACRFDRDFPALFHASLAFNVFIEREPLASTALAIQPRRKGSPVYFMHPAKEGILLGTVHASWNGTAIKPVVDEILIEHLVDDVNLAIPGFDLKRADVRRVLAGFLPAVTERSTKISRRPAMHLHANDGGPRGLLSLCGVKFTTARLVAEKALAAANPDWRSLAHQQNNGRPASKSKLDLGDPSAFLTAAAAEARAELQRLVEEESVTCAADLILRRTDWGLNPKHWPTLTRRVSDLQPSLPLEHEALGPPV